MVGYLSFNVSFYSRTFNYCLKRNWGHTKEEKREKKKNICIMVNTMFDKHSKYEKNMFKFDQM